MSFKSLENVAENRQKITFDVDHATFENAINKVYRSRVKNIAIPGFRKGKAPRALVEKMYGKEVFYDDAVNEIIPDAYADAIKEESRVIVSRPEFEVESIDECGVVISATYYTKPEVEVSDYLGIPVERPTVHVTDEEVDEELKRVQNRNSRMIDISDRAAEDGDLVTIDFDGYIDGEPFEGGKADGHRLKLGSGQFIPGFEEQVVGHSIGDSFEVNVTFPEDYHAEELQGKAAVFKCVLHEIKYNELPVLDDDFAKDVSEFDTLEEYKADIRAKAEEAHKKHADDHVDEQLITAIGDRLVANIPECMYENEVENRVRDYDNRLRMNGLDLKTYFQYTGMDLDRLREQMRPEAERQVKATLALEKIAAQESFAISDEEIADEYKRLAEVYGMEEDKLKEAVDADSIANDLKVRKAIELIREKAIVTEVEEPADAHDAE